MHRLPAGRERASRGPAGREGAPGASASYGAAPDEHGGCPLAVRFSGSA
jgi:hypothetical protein